MNILVSLLIAFHVFGENPDQESLAKVRRIREQIDREFKNNEDLTASRIELNSIYGSVDPQHWVPTDLLTKALSFFEKNKSKFKNKNYITIVDFSQRSDQYRLFFINLQTGNVERYHTTHGEGSDVNRDGYAEIFANIPNSKKSSLGFVRTAEVYNGTFGRSLRLDGLSSTNSRIRERAIVFHGWAPVIEAPRLQPMSWGCITTDVRIRDGLINKIKNGSLMLVDVSQE